VSWFKERGWLWVASHGQVRFKFRAAGGAFGMCTEFAPFISRCLALSRGALAMFSFGNSVVAMQSFHDSR